MVMPLAGRVVAAVLGGLLVLASVSSVSGTRRVFWATIGAGKRISSA